MDALYFLKKADWSCRIAPGFGSNVISLRHKGIPVLREPESIHTLAAAPVLYGIPLLLPPNRTRDGRFVFDGKEYQLPVNEPLSGNHLHGLLHSAPFRVTEYSDSHLKTVLVNQGAWFPFPFRIDLEDRLDAQGFHRLLRIASTGGAMPLALGFHTAFAEPEWFSVPIGSRWVTDCRHIPTGRLEELTAAQRTYRSGCSPKGQSISGFYTAVGDTAQIGAYRFRAEGFDQWILYNGGGEGGYLCVEPQLCPVNALASGCCGRLEPGGTAVFELHITKT